MMLTFSCGEGQLGKALAQPQSGGNRRLPLHIVGRKQILTWQGMGGWQFQGMNSWPVGAEQGWV